MELADALPLYSPKNGVPFEELKAGSAKKVLWVCAKNHEWEQPVRNLLSSNGCPVCSGRKILLGYNDLSTLHPHLASQWHPTRNLPLTMEDISFGSTKKVWWIDEHNHEWEDTIAHRVKRGSGCPVCVGKKIISGVNDVLTLYPHLKPEVSDKNTVDVTTLSSHSGKQVWWQCSKGHHWQASVDSRTKKQATGCPYCSNRKVSEDYTANLPDELKKLWHPTKNHSGPNEVTVGSNRRVWWQCEKGHEWQGVINKQRKTHTCPYCFGRKVLQGFNDVATTHPQLLPEWDRTLNSLTPEEVKAGSEQRVWWRCNKGHTWQATVTNRARLKQGCPSCWSRKFVSKVEEAVVKFLQDDLNQQVDTTVRNLLVGQELDMYLPKHKIAIEFNGVYWHSEQAGKDPKAHYKKWQACKEQGIQLIQIWEDDWRDRPELVKRMLAHKLGASREEVVQARKTSVISLTQEQTDEFLLQNHIQGSVNGGLRYGLIYLDRIVAVMVLKTKTPGVLDLLRYATSVSVPGGFTKLLKHVVRNVERVSAIETFSDHCVSDGKLYEANGFQNAGDIPPDYMYVVKGVRRHKFGYRLANFRNSSDLIYKDGLTERELADLNNLPRIWDAGKTKWRKTV